MMEIGEVDKQMMIKVNDGDDSVLGLYSLPLQQSNLWTVAVNYILGVVIRTRGQMTYKREGGLCNEPTG